MTSKQAGNNRVQSQYRIPEDLYEWLKSEAQRQNRSTNAQLVHLVQTAKNGASK